MYRRGYLARILLTSAFAAVVTAPVLFDSGVAHAASGACAAGSPLPADLAGELASTYPGQRFSIEVKDSSGCTYTLNPDLRIGTASVVKMEFMAGVLLRAQNEGRGLTQWEQDQIWPMITRSDNNAATALWQYLGQDPGMQQVDAAFGLSDTQHAGGFWGLTTTSVADQARLISEVIPGFGGPLNAQSRSWAKYYMTNVIPEQRWGASDGVPSGWTVSQKNGFAGSQCCNWRINSIGWIDRPNGSGWAIAVMSDGWASEQDGINAIQPLSARINSAMASFNFTRATGDFSGDGSTDNSTWRPSDGTFRVLRSQDGVMATRQWGWAGDVPVPADYDGDGITDFATWRPSDGTFRVLRSRDGVMVSRQWGWAGDVPVPADFDGDGVADFATWRPSDGTFRVLRSRDGVMVSRQWGWAGDVPVPADYDGDGLVDFATWRPGDGKFRVLRTRDGAMATRQWGWSSDVPVPADFDGDGVMDFATWRPSDGTFRVLRSTDGTMVSRQWGWSSDVPVPADFDGDGITDFATWRPSDGTFRVLRSRDGAMASQQWGWSSDIPTVSILNRRLLQQLKLR